MMLFQKMSTNWSLSNGESLATLQAQEGPLSRVLGVVDSEVGLLDKGLGADLALEGSLIVMPHLVFLQYSATGERLTTLGTGILPLCIGRTVDCVQVEGGVRLL